MVSSKIQHLQLLQQNLQNVLLQKQQIESQLLEIDSALSELKKSEKAYKIVGRVMLSSSKTDLEKDLNDKKETLQVRLNNFSKQEEKLKENMDKAQQDVLQELKPKK